VFLLSLLSAVPVAASTKGGGDPLCAPLRKFVASVSPHEKRELIFRTSWGDNFKGETEEVMSAIRCEHNGYEPAQAVCAYLMKNASIEFAGINAERAISCISPRTKFAPLVDLRSGDFSLQYGTTSRGSLVEVKLYEDAEVGGMALSISADGY